MTDRNNDTLRESGRGDITVEHFGLSTTKISSLSSAYPLRLIAPRPSPKSRAVLVFVLTYGGGLVAGDETNLRVKVSENARLGLLTQGSTKIYKSPSSEVCTIQTLTATIHDGGALLVLPDPVQPFADSVYAQRQVFELDHNRSSLLLLDWVCEGRSTRGESWSFTKWKGSNEVWSLCEASSGAKSSGRRLLLRDNIKLDSSRMPVPERVEGSGVLGILIITGPLFVTLGELFLKKYVARPRIGEKIWTSTGDRSDNEEQNADAMEQDLDPNLTWTATSTRKFVVVRFHAKTVERARRWLRGMVMQDGTVEKEFGHQHLLCLQDR